MFVRSRLATLILALVTTVGFCGPVSAQKYVRTDLVSNQNGVGTQPRDTFLVNAWGIARSATSPWWVNDNGTGVSTLYNGSGQKILLNSTPSHGVTIPTPDGTGTSTPTGIVFNGTPDFQVGLNKPALFIFATEDGTISGWNPGVNATQAVLKVNNSPAAVYKGLALAQNGGQNFLYAANFRSGNVDVFDKNFHAVSFGSGAFHDVMLPAGFAPFSVANINGNLVVNFAQQDEALHDEVDGKGLGYVDLFSPDGALLLRFEHNAHLDAPWGVALAPASGFGEFSGHLIVGQFGSGEIATFDMATGEFTGLIRDRHGKPITIDGLWGIGFGNDHNAGPSTTLFFAAGPDGESNGLFGTVTFLPPPYGND